MATPPVTVLKTSAKNDTENIWFIKCFERLNFIVDELYLIKEKRKVLWRSERASSQMVVREGLSKEAPGDQRPEEREGWTLQAEGTASAKALG